MVDSSEIIKLGKEGRADELRNILRDKAYRSLYYFTKFVMGYKELVGHLHIAWCDFVQNTARTIRHRGLLQPRGHFKSTIGKGYSLWRLLPRLEKDPWGNAYDEDIKFCHDPNTRILYISESEEVAGKNIKDLKWAIENNQILKWL